MKQKNQYTVESKVAKVGSRKRSQGNFNACREAKLNSRFKVFLDFLNEIKLQLLISLLLYETAMHNKYFMTNANFKRLTKLEAKNERMRDT